MLTVDVKLKDPKYCTDSSYSKKAEIVIYASWALDMKRTDNKFHFDFSEVNFYREKNLELHFELC